MPTDKFAHEKNRKKDLIRDRGADPIWLGIRKDDEYLSQPAIMKFLATKIKPERKQMTLSEDEDEELIAGLSPESRDLFGKLMLSHPDTMCGNLQTKPDGEIRVELTRTNSLFLHELRRALNGLDRLRK